MKHFSIEELSRSDFAEKHKIPNSPSPDVIRRLEALVENILYPLRDFYGKPIRVNSGYRSPKLNVAVGGAHNSQHLRGEAADITAGSPSENRKLFAYIQHLGLPFDQLIDEHSYRWLHVSYSDDHSRRQILHL